LTLPTGTDNFPDPSQASTQALHVTRRTRSTVPGRPVALALAVLVWVAIGCGRDPFAFNWSDAPDTVLLFSLARPELNLVSGYAFQQGVRVRIEAAASTGLWDIAIDTRDGEMVMLPPRALGVQDAEARIATLGTGMSLEDVTVAPADTLAYVDDEPVVLALGTIYVVKTNRAIGSFGSSCVYHAKMEAVDIDIAGGTLTFRHVTNPVCNSRDLVPPD